MLKMPREKEEEKKIFSKSDIRTYAKGLVNFLNGKRINSEYGLIKMMGDYSVKNGKDNGEK